MIYASSKKRKRRGQEKTTSNGPSTFSDQSLDPAAVV